MAILTRLERKKIASPWVRKIITGLGQSKNLSLSDLEPAIQYTEDWIAANQASYVAGLPQPFKANTDASAKVLLFAYTLMKRAGLLS
ncbi:hypothetical protein LCGC14_1815930 [marine sediment metagenome]|uniref:Uncharacterized protein n=1 Tax=marine sediment metagenome TaxID=412755 RepID=A0A0F9J080_9ZZZZ